MCYMLRSLGVPVNVNTALCGDNLGMTISSTNLDSELKNKHLEITYHKLQESVADIIFKPILVCTTVNQSNILMKCMSVGKLGSLSNT